MTKIVFRLGISCIKIFHLFYLFKVITSYLRKNMWGGVVHKDDLVMSQRSFLNLDECYLYKKLLDMVLGHTC